MIIWWMLVGQFLLEINISYKYSCFCEYSEYLLGKNMVVTRGTELNEWDRVVQQRAGRDK